MSFVQGSRVDQHPKALALGKVQPALRHAMGDEMTGRWARSVDLAAGAVDSPT
jgi:hypothetical protein